MMIKFWMSLFSSYNQYTLNWHILFIFFFCYFQAKFLLQHSNILETILCTVVNLLLIVLLNKTRFRASKTRFLAFLVGFWTRNLAYPEATNSGILLQHRNILETMLCTVVNLLLIVLLNKTRFTVSKTRFLAFLVGFWTRNLTYPEATNSGILLQHSNILETMLCTVVNLLLIILLNKTRFTASKTRFLGFRSIFGLET